MQPNGFPQIPGIDPQDIVRGVLTVIALILMSFGITGMPEGSSMHSKEAVVVKAAAVKESTTQTRERLIPILTDRPVLFATQMDELMEEAQKIADKAAKDKSFPTAPNKSYLFLSKENTVNLNANDFKKDIQNWPIFNDQFHDTFGVGVARNNERTYVVVICPNNGGDEVLENVTGEPATN